VGRRPRSTSTSRSPSSSASGCSALSRPMWTTWPGSPTWSRRSPPA
jgi:hypothetical protein